jgi:glucose-6-phosphate dehydrogenase assembly protein OpcA
VANAVSASGSAGRDGAPAIAGRGAESGAAPVPADARAVDVDAIERELHALLFEPPEDGEVEEGKPGATRACMSNLLVWTACAADAARVDDDIREIAEHHPSRILLLVGDAPRGGNASAIDAYVSAVCHLGDAGRRLCSEHVVLQGGPAASRRLVSVARTLAIGDLPTSLWWTSPVPPPLAGEVFGELVEMSEQIIFDGASWPDVPDAIARTDEWVRRIDHRDAVCDLAWARLEPWRGLLVCALDPSIEKAALPGLREVRVEHGPKGLCEALLLAGWMAARLGWRVAGPAQGDDGARTWSASGPSGTIALRIQRGAGSVGGLERVSVRWGAGDAERVEVAADERGRLSIVSGGRPERPLTLPQRGRAALVARELADIGGDPIYRDALHEAAVLVGEGSR